MSLSILRAPLLASMCSAAFACPPLAPDAARALTLDAALERIDACHPGVRAAQRTLATADAERIVAGQKPNPQLTLGAATIGRDLGSGSLWNKTFDHQLRVDQQIERGNKPALRVATAQAQRAAAAAELADARRLARLAITTAFYDLAAAQARREELSASVALGDQSLQALDRRVRSGDAAPLEATRVRVDVLRAQGELRQADADARALRVQLSALVGAPEVVDALVAALPAPPAEPPPGDASRRADVLAAQSRQAAAERQRSLTAAQRTRDVGVGVQLSRYPTSPANTSGTGNTVSLFVSVPLFLRHGLEGETARAEAELRAAEETLLRTRLAADAELARARAQWEGALARHRLTTEELLPAAERLAAGAELAYGRGASGVLEVLDARRNLRSARVERINAQAELAKAAAALEAAGRPAEAP